jgi:hypothetical protein
MLPSGVIKTIPTPNVGRPFSSVLEAQSKYIYQAFDVGLDASKRRLESRVSACSFLAW